MKKFVIFLLLVSCSQILFSQENQFFKKTTILTGGSFSFDIQKTDYPDIPAHQTKYRNYKSDFYLGYYFFDHFAVGLKTNISTYRERLYFDTDIRKYKYSDIAVGPFIRYSSTFNMFIEGGADFGYIKYAETSRKNYSYYAGLGYSIFLSNSVALEPQIKYKYYHRPVKGTMDEEIRNDLSFSLGLQIYLDLKRKKKIT